MFVCLFALICNQLDSMATLIPNIHFNALFDVKYKALAAWRDSEDLKMLIAGEAPFSLCQLFGRREAQSSGRQTTTSMLIRQTAEWGL